MDGGAGNDWLDYRGSQAGVTVRLHSAVANGGDAQGDSFVNVERIFGSNHDDILSGAMGRNIIRGGDGNDVLDGRGGRDWLFGEAGDDTFIFNRGADLMDGGTGFDRAFFVGTFAEYAVLDLGGNDWQVTQKASGDMDRLFSVEALLFDDLTLA
jgi:Ca2+-binding RTX toxin-like protein